MRVSELYPSNPLRGQDVYLVGLGPSMTVFPTEFLEDKICVLLNDAHKIFPSLGPVSFANHKVFLDAPSDRTLVQVVKGRLKSDPFPERDDNHVPWDDRSTYVFSYRMAPHDPVDCYNERLLFAEGEQDHYWRGPIAVFAAQFAVLCGARSVTAVGCDCGRLNGKDYCDPRLEQWRRDLSKDAAIRLGKTKQKDRHGRLRTVEINVRHNYEDYAYGLIVVQDAAARRFNVPIVSMSPFFGVGPRGEKKPGRPMCHHLQYEMSSKLQSKWRRA